MNIKNKEAQIYLLDAIENIAISYRGDVFFKYDQYVMKIKFSSDKDAAECQKQLETWAKARLFSLHVERAGCILDVYPLW